ncbi:hypothetical protein ACFL1S_08550 [Pseudomonadota bacterium]
MKQLGLNDSGFVKRPKKIRKARFLDEIDRVVPWSRLMDQIKPRNPKAGNGRRPGSLAIGSVLEFRIFPS